MPEFNPAAILAELVDVEAGLEVLGRQRAQLRKVLEDEARRLYADGEGIVPRWELRGRITTTLSGAGLYEPVVTDRSEWTEWVGCSHPTEAELVVRIPVSNTEAIVEAGAVCALPGVTTTTEVRSGILKALAESAPTNGAVCPLITEGGEIIPGVELVRKGGHLAVTVDPSAKARAITALERPPILTEVVGADAWRDGDQVERSA